MIMRCYKCIFSKDLGLGICECMNPNSDRKGSILFSKYDWCMHGKTSAKNIDFFQAKALYEIEMAKKEKDRDAGRNDMTLEELAKYAKEVGVPDRVFKETFRSLFERENKVLNDYEALVAKAECDRQAEYWKEFKKFLDHNRAEREKRKKDKEE